MRGEKELVQRKMAQNTSGEKKQLKKETTQEEYDDDQDFCLLESHIKQFSILNMWSSDQMMDENDVVEMEIFGKVSNSRYHCIFTCNPSKFPIDTADELLGCIQTSIEGNSNVHFDVNQEERCFYLNTELELIPGKTKAFSLRGSLKKLKQTPKTEMAMLSTRIEEMEKRLKDMEYGACIVAKSCISSTSFSYTTTEKHADGNYIQSTKYEFKNICAPFNTQEIIFGMEDQCLQSGGGVTNAPQTITFKAFDESHLYRVDNGFSPVYFNFQAGIQKLIHLQSIKLMRKDLDPKVVESFFEYISPVTQIKVFHCVDFKFPDLKGMNLPTLFHLERLTIHSQLLENVSNCLPLFPKLKYLNLTCCPKLISHEKMQLDKICKRRKVELEL